MTILKIVANGDHSTTKDVCDHTSLAAQQMLR